MSALPTAPLSGGSVALSVATTCRVSSSCAAMGGSTAAAVSPPIPPEHQWKSSWPLLPPLEPLPPIVAARTPCFTVAVVGAVR